MLSEIDLTNFKRFTRARIPLKKINIFVGPNNSGKSSILAAIKLLIQTLDSYDEQVPLLLNGTFGDFGTYKDVIYKNHRGRPLEIGFKAQVPISPGSEAPLSEAQFNLSYKFNSSKREIILESIKVNLNEKHLIHLRYSVDSSRFNIESIADIDIPAAFKSTISRDIRVRHFLPVPLTQRLGQSFSNRNTPVEKFSQENIDQELIRTILRISRRTGELLESSDYLGPVRYLFTGERRSRIGSSGENMTTVLIKGAMTRGKKDHTGIQSKINEWLVKSKMAKQVEIAPISDRHYEIHVENYFTGEKQNIADVGYGHSQVLPILVGGYSMGSGSTFLIEQPELHLHPKAQAELGDFFLDLFNNDVQTIIETHSEHLILRLQQHIASGKISPNDIAVYFIKNTTDTTPTEEADCISPEIIHLQLNKLGEFITHWPEGFFPERLNESRKLAQIRQSKLSTMPSKASDRRDD
jgi:predicted ATPase